MVEDAQTFGCYLTDDVLNEDSSDPANSDPILREQLEQNSIISKKREAEVIHCSGFKLLDKLIFNTSSV